MTKYLCYGFKFPPCSLHGPSFCFAAAYRPHWLAYSNSDVASHHLCWKLLRNQYALTQCVRPRLRYKRIPLAWHQNWVFLAVRSESLAFKSAWTYRTSRRAQKCSHCVSALTCPVMLNITVCESMTHRNVGVVLCQYLNNYLCCITQLRLVLSV